MGILFGALAATAAGLAVLVWAILRVSQASQARKKARAPKTEAELAAEHALRLDREAQKHLASGNLEAARLLFIEAKRPGKAAQVAFREGKLALAAELFEKDGRLDKALVAYRKAGNAAKVAELSARFADAEGKRKEAAKAKEEADEGRSSGVVESGTDHAAKEAQQQVSFKPASEPPVDDWANLPSEASDAFLLEEESDSLLELPAGSYAEAPEANASAASRVALGMIGLIKSRKARTIVEETVAVQRRRNDSR